MKPYWEEVFLCMQAEKAPTRPLRPRDLEARVTLVAKLGNDIFGEQSLAGFKKEKIHTDFVFVEDNTASGTALIIVNEEGENRSSLHPAPTHP